MFLMILARLALLPAAVAAATAGLLGLSSFLTTAGDAVVPLFLLIASGVVVTSTELVAVAAEASRWRPLVITDAGERERAERELRDRSTRVSTGLACLGCVVACFLGDSCCCWGWAEVAAMAGRCCVGARRSGSDLRLFRCDNGFTAVGASAIRTHELLVDRVVDGSFFG